MTVVVFPSAASFYPLIRKALHAHCRNFMKHRKAERIRERVTHQPKATAITILENFIAKIQQYHLDSADIISQLALSI